MAQKDTLKRIVVIGGGVAGLEVATSLGRHRCRHGFHVTLVDHDSAHVWKPMLHTIAAGTRDISQQQTPYIAQAGAAGFVYQPGELCGLEREARQVLLAPMLADDGRELVPARRLAYDALVIAVGSQANDFGTPGVAEHCDMIDSRLQADAFNREVRVRMLQCLGQNEDLSIAIVGGGATGVELAAELVQLTEEAEAYGAEGLGEKVSITLLEAGDRLLNAFPEKISRLARQRLEALGVKVMMQTSVKAAHADSFELEDGTRVRANPKVWAAGVKAPDILKDLGGLQSAKNNTLLITPTLQTTRDPAIFALGDCSSLTLPGKDKPLPPTAQVAHQQAQYLVRHLPAFLAGGQVPPFRYRDFGALVSLGTYNSYGSLGKFGFYKGGFIQGWAAQFSHAMLYRQHQARIHGFWRGGMLWLVDILSDRVRPRVRMD